MDDHFGNALPVDIEHLCHTFLHIEEVRALQGVSRAWRAHIRNKTIYSS